MTDPRWTLLQELKPTLLRVFAESGAVRVEYVSAFPDQEGVWVWLGTATDSQRDALVRRGPSLLAEVRLAAENHGMEADSITGVSVESEQTVTRDFGGSWFYRLR